MSAPRSTPAPAAKPGTRLLLVDPDARTVGETEMAQLPALLSPADLLVVNDAATLPASLHAQSERGAPLEIRLLEGPHQRFTRAVLFGSGDYRTPTELRPPPPPLSAGELLRVADGFALSIAHVAPLSPRLVILDWKLPLAERFAALYAHAHPVQYSYMPEPLALWDVQTVFAARPWAVEMPSAARPLTGAILTALRARGLSLAQLTHAAGLSATGDPLLDAALPLPERYEIPERTARQLDDTRRRGGRVIAVGTSVVRALEDAASRTRASGQTVPTGAAQAELVLDADTPRRVVSGLLTGIHIPGESHYRLLQAFVDGPTLARSVELAQLRGYRAHEFGDACLILPGLSQARAGLAHAA
jgi:S-adenosylmethionine:tRNA ribosyltransferase-isomerase